MTQAMIETLIKALARGGNSPERTRALNALRSWDVFPLRSTVSSDVSREATAKDRKFMEHMADLREFGRTHPSVKTRQEEHARKNEEIIGLGSVVRRQPKAKAIPRVERVWGPGAVRQQVNAKADKRAEKALRRLK